MYSYSLLSGSTGAQGHRSSFINSGASGERVHVLDQCQEANFITHKLIWFSKSVEGLYHPETTCSHHLTPVSVYLLHWSEHGHPHIDWIGLTLWMAMWLSCEDFNWLQLCLTCPSHVMFRALIHLTYIHIHSLLRSHTHFFLAVTVAPAHTLLPCMSALWDGGRSCHSNCYVMAPPPPLLWLYLRGRSYSEIPLSIRCRREG